MNKNYTSIKGHKLQSLVRNRLLKVLTHLIENDIDVPKTV